MQNHPLDIRDAIFDQIYEIAKKDKNYIFIADDMDAFSLRKFKKDFPAQYINIGVAEQNMIDVAAGLASCGKKVVCFGICSYVTTRCYEQIRFSVCSMHLPVTIIGIGAGFSFNFDGPSHQGIHDLAAMRLLPEMTIYNPSDSISAAKFAVQAYKNNSPAYIRLDKGTFPKFYDAKDDLSSGFKVIYPLKNTNIITTGFTTQHVINILESLDITELGVVDLSRIKPISKKYIDQILKKSKNIITIEENVKLGGIGTITSEIITENNIPVKLKILGLEDRQFDVFGSREWLLSLNNLDTKSLGVFLKKLASENAV